MARRLFGARKGQPESLSLQAMGWSGPTDTPRARTAHEPSKAPPVLPPPRPPASRGAGEVPPDQQEAELLERVAAFRTEISDTLYAASKDYQVLCNLMQEDLTHCDDIAGEMRRRLADNIDYSVLTKLDEVHALLSAHLGSKA